MQVSLRPLSTTDLSVVLAWSRDEEFCLANEWQSEPPVEQIHRWLTNSANGEFPDLVRLGVVCDSELIGYVDLANMTDVSAEFGIAIGDSNRWGHGFGTAAGRAILAYAFDDLGLHHVDAVVSSSNLRSQQLVNRLGFWRSPPSAESLCDSEPFEGRLSFRLTDDQWRIATARIVPMTVDDAECAANWQYIGPWSIYNLASSAPLIQDLDSYRVVVAGVQLVGFCSIGASARVGDLDPDPTILDIGLGMDPAMAGRGLGGAFGRTVLRYIVETYPNYETLRACIQSWNHRSLRLAHRLGFVDTGDLRVTQDDQLVDDG